MRLSELVQGVRFPLVAFPAGFWSGPMFVGDVRSIGDEVRALQLVYLTPQADSGLLVSHLAPEATTSPEDPLRLVDHLASFVTQFDPSVLVPKAKRGRMAWFPERDLDQHEEVGMICGQPTSFKLIAHRRLPLRAMRAGLVRNGQVVDLCVAGWKRPVADELHQLEPMTREVVQRFDTPDESTD